MRIRAGADAPRAAAYPRYDEPARRAQGVRNRRAAIGGEEMGEASASGVRKRRLDEAARRGPAPGALDLARLATIAYSSEDPAHPVENLLDGRAGPGGSRWAAARPDETAQLIVEFDRPQAIARLVYEVEEAERERTQAVRVEASTDGGRTYRGVLAQDYTFSPRGATFQREDVRLDLGGVDRLRLTVVPNKGGSGTATLTTLQLFA